MCYSIDSKCTVTPLYNLDHKPLWKHFIPKQARIWETVTYMYFLGTVV